MVDFFRGLSFEKQREIVELSKFNCDLREMQKYLLAKLNMNNIDELYNSIIDKSVPVIPAYDYYLTIKILEEKRQDNREQIKIYLRNNE